MGKDSSGISIGWLIFLIIVSYNFCSDDKQDTKNSIDRPTVTDSTEKEITSTKNKAKKKLSEVTNQVKEIIKKKNEENYESKKNTETNENDKTNEENENEGIQL